MNRRGWTPLLAAVGNRSAAIARALLDAGANVNETSGAPLRNAYPPVSPETARTLAPEPSSITWMLLVTPDAWVGSPPGT